MSYVKEPLSPPEAKKRIRGILKTGNVLYDTGPKSHLLAELKNDEMSILDCMNILRGGAVLPGEYENGSWRYRVETNRMCVVVRFLSETQLFMITAWRMKKR